MKVEIEVSFGELLDKLSILEIKSTKITDPDKLENVNNELSKLNKISKKEGRNISDVIREAIAEYLLTRNYLSDDPNKIISKKSKPTNKTIESIIESLAESYYNKNLTSKKPATKKKTRKQKNQTIEEILENPSTDFGFPGAPKSRVPRHPRSQSS